MNTSAVSAPKRVSPVNPGEESSEVQAQSRVEVEQSEKARVRAFYAKRREIAAGVQEDTSVVLDKMEQALGECNKDFAILNGLFPNKIGSDNRLFNPVACKKDVWLKSDVSKVTISQDTRERLIDGLVEVAVDNTLNEEQQATALWMAAAIALDKFFKPKESLLGVSDESKEALVSLLEGDNCEVAGFAALVIMNIWGTYTERTETIHSQRVAGAIYDHMWVAEYKPTLYGQYHYHYQMGEEDAANSEILFEHQGRIEEALKALEALHKESKDSHAEKGHRFFQESTAASNFENLLTLRIAEIREIGRIGSAKSTNTAQAILETGLSAGDTLEVTPELLQLLQHLARQ